MAKRLPLIAWAASVALALAGAGGLGAAWAVGGWAGGVDWAPSLGLRLGVTVDGLGILYGLLATGVALAVLVYSRAYLPRHMEHHHERRSPVTEARFFALLGLFMVSMVGLAVADDLVLLFVFWDLTAVASYFLIGFDRHERRARVGALTALLVTGVTAVALLVAIALLAVAHGTFSLGALVERAQPSGTLTAAGALVLVAALAKSAQVPFHFWLPRAMIAPTPVSAYLHSAAMVAAGVFLLTRFHPLLVHGAYLEETLVVVGAASIFVGGTLALAADEMKQVLAYSTIAQYGYVTLLLGLGEEKAVAAASFYVLAHAAAKSGLFLSAGAVAETAGQSRLSRLGGLARESPLLAAVTGVLAAGLAALPVTIGFFKDELLFAATWERSPLLGAVAVAAAALTVAYAWRFWSRIFLGPRRTETEAIPRSLVWAPAALAGIVVAGGVFPDPFARLAEAAAAAAGAEVAIDPSYVAAPTLENLMAAAAYAVGAGLAALLPALEPLARGVSRLGRHAGPHYVFRLGLAALNGLSDRIHWLEVHDLRTRVAAVLVPGGLLVAAGAAATPTSDSYAIGSLQTDDLPLAIVLVVAAVAALAATVPRVHVAIVLVLSASGFSLAAVYALFDAPDVALVAVLVETVLALLFFGILSLLPRDVLRREAALRTSRRRRWRDPLIGVVSGGTAFVVVWGALSRPTPERTVADDHVALAPEAHFADVVTAVLADFRGLDTAGEITVVTVALVGVLTLLAGGAPWPRRS